MIFTAVSLWLISVSNPLTTKSSKSIRRGDEGFQVHFSFLDELDGGFMIAAVRDGAAQINFLQHDLLHIHRGRVTPDRDVDDDAGGLHDVEHRVQHGIHACTFKRRIGPSAVGQVQHTRLDVVRAGVENVIRNSGRRRLVLAGGR